MPERTQRMRRVNEALKEVLSQEIGRGLKDPRIGFVTVTGVDTTADLRHAKVYVSVLGKGVQKQDTLDGLHSAGGYLQGVVAHELRLKRTPTLEFVYDQSIDEGMKIHAMLQVQEHGLEGDAGGERSAADHPEGMDSSDMESSEGTES